MKFADMATLEEVKTTKEGYLIASVKAARTGIQRYAGWELGRPDLKFVDLYRPKESVFQRDSLESFPNIPLTIGHPKTPVNADNYQQENVGNVFEVAREGEAIRASIQIMAKRAIDAIKAGTRQLSVGYDADIEWEPGISPEGEPYQALQKNISANHLAIVAQGRAGPDCQIPECQLGDGATPQGIRPISQKGEHNMPKAEPTTLLVNGREIQISKQGARIIEDLQKRLAQLQEQHAQQIAEKDKLLGKKDAEIAKLKGERVKDGAYDARVARRAQLVADARNLVGEIKCEGMSDAALRHSVVGELFGRQAVENRSDSYIEARFDAALEQNGCDPVRQAVIGGKSHQHINDNGQTGYERRLSEAWKPQTNRGVSR